MKMFSKPQPQSNAAFIGGAGVMALLGVVLADSPYVQLGSLAVCVTALATGCLLGDTTFGKKNFAETVKEIYQSFSNSASPEAPQRAR